MNKISELDGRGSRIRKCASPLKYHTGVSTRKPPAGQVGGLWRSGVSRALTFLACLALAGCDLPWFKSDLDGPGGNMHVMTDKVTGCQYVYAGAYGLTPRIAADGKSHRGCKEGAK